MLRPSLLVAILLSLGLIARAEDNWPSRTVTIEEMKILTPVHLFVPKVRAQGKIRGPVVLRIHVDASGAVRRTVLIGSCGSPAHDEAALKSMRLVRFAPKLIDGEATDVSLVVPFHLPLPKSAFDDEDAPVK
ncbi:MAG TPA: hypothetical protein DET46_02745 [Comamonadaceae bacterium]|nr:MAG: hypothetical protein A2Z55_01405 [Burkholderiales bacterium RIFCSPHIGHO2_12_63_9]OGB55086.1 MAG: hypothetical protein A3F71_05585 [Burkholderiales bacterium RIFCSPLOWO2_12_FULL_64_33]HCE27834.1 hypothetical protein [Comamonadaceae bacterium]